ncbi:cation diffusion facilitator family transporter [Dissulfurimicrobium hydrothermale]|uniref:cation diffusion facilitator family transporter n=2 Tax=Dissulfurimicrobium TaxID=1769732 RepID=UPI001EDB4380|nr:cation diffusion facilitator family transporter [Dissulfurimicrobium hydrothermale]UKL13249.1 cation diffusion facilitator family transporter [Dissulfurimicrobium hydrothermale]
MRSVKVAITANFLVTCLKFIVAFSSGSASMLAEAVHSLADTLNQGFIWVGIIRSKIGPSKEFPFGRGQERYVWGLISACGIFFVGAGVTIYHGIVALVYPREPLITNWTLAVLAVSFIAEGSSLVVAIIDKKDCDTANLAVLLEDSAAVFGLFLAAVAVLLTRFTGHIYWDAVGSIIVGVVLAAIAVILIFTNLEYLIEKASPEELHNEVREYLKDMPLVEDIKDIRMIVLTPDTHRIRAEVELNGYLLIKEMSESLKEDYEQIENFTDFLQFCAAFANRITRTVGAKIDEMEDALKKKAPYLKNVDIKPS